MNNYTRELNEILGILSENLDISKTQYEQAVQSYQAVGNLLSTEYSELAKYEPKILPQGSFLLGTVIKPICEEDDIDVDLVCQLMRKPNHWTQRHLKDAVGDILKGSERYRKMIKDGDGGRRCWTLVYADTSNYHMDILPAVADGNLEAFLKEGFGIEDSYDYEKGVIKITDKEADNFSTETNSTHWLKSNPFGYARWFYVQSITDNERKFSLNETIEPIQGYSANKSPLQRVVQLLKRHRDIMFSREDLDSENRPISIIITTLAARAYADNKMNNVLDAFISIAGNLKNYIEESVDETGAQIKLVKNPVNSSENFADKWQEVKQKQDYFYMWLDQLESDIQNMRNGEGLGLSYLNESFTKMFGENLSRKTFSDLGKIKRTMREEGKRKMASKTGVLGTTGTVIKRHNFYGKE